MKIAVTGATGFLGKRLTHRLDALGHELVAIGRNVSIGDQLEQSGIAFKRADLTRKAEMKDLFQSVDMIVHCAALSSPWGSESDFYAANVIAAKNVIAECRTHNIQRLIHISSPSIYFNGTHRYGVKESDPLPKISVNNYARTKLLAEAEVDQAFRQGLDTITIRPRGIFGSGDTAIFPRLLQANERGIFPLIAGGQAMMDLTHVDNVVEAILLCLHASSGAMGKKYNITNDDPRTLLQIMQLLCTATEVELKAKKIPFRIAHSLAAAMEFLYGNLTKKEPPLTKYSVALLAKSMTLDIGLAKQDLGYTPKVSLEEGIKEFANWWRREREYRLL